MHATDLNLLRQLTQHLDVLVAEVVQFPVGLRRAGLRHDAGVEELVQLVCQRLVDQVHLLCHDVGGKVIVSVLDVQQQQVDEALAREARL